MVNLSAKDKRIADAKIKGLKNKDIGTVEYPQAKPNSQAVLVSRVLKKQAVAQYYLKGRELAIEQSGLNWGDVISPIKDALQAVKNVTSHTEADYEVVDHAIRLTASKRLYELLKDNTEPEDRPSDIIDKIADIGDDIELQRIVFKRHE